MLAGLINAVKLAGKKIESVKIAISGAGAAAIAVAKFLLLYGVAGKNILFCDTKGIVYYGRKDLSENKYKSEIASKTNLSGVKGGLAEAVKGADVFIGLSRKGLLTKEMVKSMSSKSIVFAMANPDPEIMPSEAKEAGAFVIASGRSDFPNQVNNALAFPGVFRGALDCRANKITSEMKISAAEALASMVKNLSVDNILPSVIDKEVPKKIAKAVMGAWKKQK